MEEINVYITKVKIFIKHIKIHKTFEYLPNCFKHYGNIQLSGARENVSKNLFSNRFINNSFWRISLF